MGNEIHGAWAAHGRNGFELACHQPKKNLLKCMQYVLKVILLYFIFIESFFKAFPYKFQF